MFSKMDCLYVRTEINQIISVDFSQIELDMSRYFIKYARNFMEGKCRKEGFIRPKSTKIESYTTPILKSNQCIYEVTFSFDVCNPEIDNIYKCKIIKLAKIGIRAVISYSDNPIVFYISREHNPTINFDNYKESQNIDVRIIGKRFQLNDSYIEVIAEIV